MANLTASYGLSRSTSPFGVIEQSEWSPYTGVLTKFGLAVLLAKLIYDSESFDYSVSCGFDGSGNVITLVTVYPEDLSRDYTPHLSHGELSERQVLEVEQTESIEFSLGTSASLKYPCRGIKSVAWQTDCYDKNLDKVAPPALSVNSDNEIVSADGVYGTATVTYIAVSHIYTVTLPLREDAEQYKYSSVFYCVYDGGVEHLVLSTPPGADEFEGSCGGGSTSIEGPDGGDPNWPNPSADRTTVYDYCDGHLISDSGAD